MVGAMKDVYSATNVKDCNTANIDNFSVILTRIRLKTKRFSSILENAIDGAKKMNKVLKSGKNNIDCLAHLPSFFSVTLKNRRAPGKVIFTHWTPNTTFKVFMSYTEPQPSQKSYF
jgi:hypothetical protein